MIIRLKFNNKIIHINRYLSHENYLNYRLGYNELGISINYSIGLYTIYVEKIDLLDPMRRRKLELYINSFLQDKDDYLSKIL